MEEIVASLNTTDEHPIIACGRIRLEDKKR